VNWRGSLQASRVLFLLLSLCTVAIPAAAQQARAMYLRASSGSPDLLIDALIELFEPRVYRITLDDRPKDVIARVCGSVTDHYMALMDAKNLTWQSGKYASDAFVVLPCLRVVANARYPIDGTKTLDQLVNDILGVGPDDLVFMGDPTKPKGCGVPGCVLPAADWIARHTQLTRDQLTRLKQPSLIVPFRTFETPLVLKPVKPGRDAVEDAIARLNAVQGDLVNILRQLPQNSLPSSAALSKLAQAPLGTRRSTAAGAGNGVPQLLRPKSNLGDGCSETDIAAGT
jgi:hypothetical protein